MTKKSKEENLVAIVKSLARLQVEVAAHLKGAVNTLNAEFGLLLDVAPMTGTESQAWNSQGSITPFGSATKGPSSEVPGPADGKAYTPGELANPGVFTRPVLARILEDLGGDSKGKMPPDLRTAILEAQGEADIGECDFTGEVGAIERIKVDGDEYIYGQQVRAFLAKKGASTPKAQKKWIRKLVAEEITL